MNKPTLNLAMPSKISECALTAKIVLRIPETDVCLPAGILNEYMTGPGATKQSAIQRAMVDTQCDTQECVLKRLEPNSAGLAKMLFKSHGATDTTLINNANIDELLKQWAHAHPTFFAYNFNMRDYASNSFAHGRVINKPDTLATIDQHGLYARGIRCSGCVINTDIYAGPGKHWMALFTDYRDTRTPTIEFFNSSGNAPSPEWVNWMQKTQAQMQAALPNVKIVRVTNVRFQQSKTECGVYSLYYIWARLSGHTLDSFINKPIDDKYMFEFRHHLFKTGKPGDAPGIAVDGKFDWDDYARHTNIKWEP